MQGKETLYLPGWRVTNSYSWASFQNYMNWNSWRRERRIHRDCQWGKSGMDGEFGVGSPTVQHRELYPISWDRPWWKIAWVGKKNVWGNNLKIFLKNKKWLSQKKKKNVYIWLGHYAAQQKVTQHCKSTILRKKKDSQVILQISKS